MRNLRRDKQHADAFFKQHFEMIEDCSYQRSPGAHMLPGCKKLIHAARAHFQYAPTTIDHDILRSLLRYHKKYNGGKMSG